MVRDAKIVMLNVCNICGMGCEHLVLGGLREARRIPVQR